MKRFPPKITFKIFYIFIFLLFTPKIYSQEVHKKQTEKLIFDNNNIDWQIFKSKSNSKKVFWERSYEQDMDHKLLENKYPIFDSNIKGLKKYNSIESLNRSIIFDNKIVGPDISWLVPPGFIWNKRFRFDSSTRGHSRRKEGESFLGWNSGDAVGQFYYQPFSLKDYSLGFNLGMRSVYSGSKSIPGGGTDIGEGLSLGFRLDKKLSDTSGVAFGAEQLVHFNGITDTGRDIYLTASKGWLNNSEKKSFPLTVATFGFATGKMAEGNIKGLCSDLFGGSGIEANKNTRLCWSPVFSLARVYNTKFSTFFEYNSKWFLLGSSISPFHEIPLRGTFAVQLSDHIENYKLNSFDELKWVFRLSLGF